MECVDCRFQLLLISVFTVVQIIQSSRHVSWKTPMQPTISHARILPMWAIEKIETIHNSDKLNPANVQIPWGATEWLAGGNHTSVTPASARSFAVAAITSYQHGLFHDSQLKPCHRPNWNPQQHYKPQAQRAKLFNKMDDNSTPQGIYSRRTHRWIDTRIKCPNLQRMISI